MAPNADVQKELDARISALELELRDLKKKRNALSPISCFPPEILYKIFVLSVPNIDYEDDEGRIKPHAMALSHVSHSWRTIALDYPEVWGHLHVGVRTKSELVDLALDRARRSPIYLNLCGIARDGKPSDSTSALTKFILERPTQCRALDLYVHEESLRSVFNVQKCGFDGLKYLKLDAFGSNHRYPLLTEFLESSFPQLRHLELSWRTRIPSDCNLLKSPHLTHIDIRGVLTVDDALIGLFALFKGSSCLQHFSVGRISSGGSSISRPESQFCDSNEATRLASLETLELRLHDANAARVVTLLQSISVPARARLQILCPRFEDITPLMVALQHAYGHLAPTALRIRGCIVTAWDHNSQDLATPWIQVDTLSDSFSGLRKCHIWEWGWSLASLRTLTLGGLSAVLPEGDAGSFWGYLAETAVETLRIDAFCVSDVTIGQLLESFRGGSNLWGAPIIPWASLQTLHSTLPRRSGYEYRRTRQNLTTPTFHQQIEYALDLVDALKERESAAGAKPLDMLEFIQPFDHPIDEDVLEMLAGGAVKVKVVQRMK